MSVITVSELQAYLRLSQTTDNSLLQVLIDGAEDEALQYMDRDSLPRTGEECPDECDTSRIDNPVSEGDTLNASCRIAIYLLVQARYDQATPADMEAMRVSAFRVLDPFRCRRGV